jgi:hypothetical protein
LSPVIFTLAVISMRRVALTEKKLRGIPRRLRALANWPSTFEHSFPTRLTSDDKFMNYKLPVHESLVDGRQATPSQRRAAAQALLDACSNLVMAKPKDAMDFRVVATICLPQMFLSEVCVYSDEDYFREMVRIGQSRHGVTKRIVERSLASEWGFSVPQGLGEFGLAFDNASSPDPEDRRVGEYWFYGEVQG